MSGSLIGANKWRALGLASVDAETLERITSQLGIDWSLAGHVTATSASARWLRQHRLRAITIAELTDLIVWEGLPANLRPDTGAYPILDIGAEDFDGRDGELARFNGELRRWRSKLGGQRAGFALRIDNTLRTYLRNSAADPAASRVLRTAIRDLRRSLVFLIQSNFRPGDFNNDEPLLKVALDAWSHLELNVPEVTNLRRDVWDHPSALSQPSSDYERALKTRAEVALTRVFGENPDGWQLLHHGFYFYSPQQWALWQLLKGHPKIGQCFIVHDDGRNRAFESWRHYFIERLVMPKIEYMEVPSDPGRASALRDALEGRRVSEVALTPNTKVIGFENSAEFVRHWRLQSASAREQGQPSPELFAPMHKELDRVIDRMSPGQTATSVNLANLPVGQFLLALHDCIEFTPSGQPELRLTGERLLDMAASGYLDIAGSSVLPSKQLAGLKRALPYFANLGLAVEWQERAVALERLVVGEISALGPRIDGLTDVARIASSAANELRLAPWCDLSETEAHAVVSAVKSAVSLGNEVIRDGSGRPNNYLDWVRTRLQRAMGKLSAEQQSEIDAKLGGVRGGLGDDELDLEGVKEVVRIILGREVEFGLSAAEDEDEGGEVTNLRYLDVFGLCRATGDIHFANLSDSLFPSRAQPYGWPFAEKHLIPQEDARVVSIELLRTRSQTAQLGDLYLFWLVIAGMSPNCELTFSWISKLGNELQNPSSLLTLIMQPKVRSESVVRLAGGIALSPPLRDNPQVANAKFPRVRSFSIVVKQREIEKASTKIDRAAASSGLACSRRFVIQWAMGPSASLGTEHMQAMLFGNVYGALSARKRFASLGGAAQTYIQRIVNDLWRHLTAGQRKSSFEKRVVKPGGASWRWVYGLSGNKSSSNPNDLAYQAAKDDAVAIPASAILGSDSGAILPPPGPLVNSEVCKMCPVSLRCSSRLQD